MTPRRWTALAVLAAALFAFQFYAMDPQPERQAESRALQIADLPAGDIVPTYVASLFFGSFRAVAIDVLWIQLKRAEEEKRWYERRELLKLISYFQPRNPEVWVHLGWHSAYNVANGFTDPERSWEWVHFGLTWLREGLRRLPESPYLKHELAYTLMHKPSWRGGGWLDVPLLKRIEGDQELQELLQDRRPVERPMSAFELARLWYARAREELRATPGQYLVTPVGLILYPDSMDGFICRAMYLQGIYDWHRGRRPEARGWFLQASEQSRVMIREYGIRISPIYQDRERFYRRLPDIVDLDFKARNGGEEDERALLRTMQDLIVTEGPLDDEFLWSRGNPQAPLNALKRKFSMNQDAQECNDSFMLATPVREGDLLQANLQPEGLDTDYYIVSTLPPPRQGVPEEKPPKPIPVKLKFGRPETAQLDLKVAVFDRLLQPLLEGTVVRGAQEVAFQADRYGLYFVKVEPAAPAAPWPADTRYTLRYSTESRP